MMWVNNQYEDDILPEELYYPNCELDRNNDNKTLLMMWIEHH